MKILKKRKKVALAAFIGFALATWFIFSLKKPLFDVPRATLLKASNGRLLSASIASDWQWRFPEADSVPYKFRMALMLYEDQYFYIHPGFNPVSIVRAAAQNISRGSIVSGASTITMQVVRLSRGRDRTILEKIIEIILAFRVELAYSKSEILRKYASNAPFGGNIVGLEAASYRYFGRPARLLTWAESCNLAVLPNSPSLVYPGKNQSKLKKKRDRLLKKLFEKGIIDEATYELSKNELLPGKPKPLPQHARHLLARLMKSGYKGESVRTTLDYDLQIQCERIINFRVSHLERSKIRNAAALVAEVETGAIVAYVGNASLEPVNLYGRRVDVVDAPRSPGSLLKPFLYAAALDEGEILPKSLAIDIPTYIGGFSPKNFIDNYDGAVPADEALARSLNVPAARLLRSYGVDKFHYILNKIGFSTVDKPPSHYGLALILGGVEVRLLEVCSAYSKMARILKHYISLDGEKRYDRRDMFDLTYFPENVVSREPEGNSDKQVFGAASIWLTFEAMKRVERPDEESSWELYSSSRRVAWKTGTSYGFRDAWAAGVTPRYCAGVWTGNADGEGRPGLTGVGVAAPILFEIFSLLPQSPRFAPPYEDLEYAEVCAKSGFLAHEHCAEIDSAYIPRAGLQSPPCPYCKTFNLDSSGKYLVDGSCYQVSKMTHEKRFVLPPAMEYYYKMKDPSYREVPEPHPDCLDSDVFPQLELFYPVEGGKIYIPRTRSGERGKIVFRAAHRDPDQTLYWHVDDIYLGSTSGIHNVALSPKPGWRKLVVVDGDGRSIERWFKILDKE